MDFGVVKIRHEGDGVLALAKSWHAFMEGLRLGDGEAALIYYTCPAVDGFVVVERVGDLVRVSYRRR